MKKVAIIIFFLLLGISAIAQKKLPKILNPGDTLKVTQKIWVQSINSEIDQRIESKQLKLKLEAYIEKTKEIESIQDSIKEVLKSKFELSEKGSIERDKIISELSIKINDCDKEATVLRKEVVLLQKDLKKAEKGKIFWRKVGLISSSVLIGIIALNFL